MTAELLSYSSNRATQKNYRHDHGFLQIVDSSSNQLHTIYIYILIRQSLKCREAKVLKGSKTTFRDFFTYSESPTHRGHFYLYFSTALNFLSSHHRHSPNDKQFVINTSHQEAEGVTYRLQREMPN